MITYDMIKIIGKIDECGSDGVTCMECPYRNEKRCNSVRIVNALVQGGYVKENKVKCQKYGKI